MRTPRNMESLRHLSCTTVRVGVLENVLTQSITSQSEFELSDPDRVAKSYGPNADRLIAAKRHYDPFDLIRHRIYLRSDRADFVINVAQRPMSDDGHASREADIAWHLNFSSSSRLV